MIVLEGASMAHVDVSQFWSLIGLVAVVPASRAFRLIRSFLGAR